MALKSEVLFSHDTIKCSNLNVKSVPIFTYKAAVKKGSKKEDSLTLMRQQ